MDATRFLASLIRAKASLHSAIIQTLPSDDRIIAGHVAEAHETLRTVLEIAQQDDRAAYSAAMTLACQEIGGSAPVARIERVVAIPHVKAAAQ
jgi:hypothetical protein